MLLLFFPTRLISLRAGSLAFINMTIILVLTGLSNLIYNDEKY